MTTSMQVIRAYASRPRPQRCIPLISLRHCAGASKCRSGVGFKTREFGVKVLAVIWSRKCSRLSTPGMRSLCAMMLSPIEICASPPVRRSLILERETKQSHGRESSEWETRATRSVEENPKVFFTREWAALHYKIESMLKQQTPKNWDTRFHFQTGTHTGKEVKWGLWCKSSKHGSRSFTRLRYVGMFQNVLVLNCNNIKGNFKKSVSL